MVTFHIQARLVKHDGERVVRNEVRLADADDRTEIFRIAHDLVRDGFTVWVWVAQPNRQAHLDLIETLRPQPQPKPTSPRKGHGTSPLHE